MNGYGDDAADDVEHQIVGGGYFEVREEIQSKMAAAVSITPSSSPRAATRLLDCPVQALTRTENAIVGLRGQIDRSGEEDEDTFRNARRTEAEEESTCDHLSHNQQRHHKKTAFSLNTKHHHKHLLVLILTTWLLLLLGHTSSAFLLDGSQSSFAQFRKWYSGLNGTLELEFKSEQPNGLVLYTDDGGTYDFFELKLVEGVLRLRYNLGGGAQIITVGRDLHDGHWHKVQVNKITPLLGSSTPSVGRAFARSLIRLSVSKFHFVLERVLQNYVYRLGIRGASGEFRRLT